LACLAAVAAIITCHALLDNVTDLSTLLLLTWGTLAVCQSKAASLTKNFWQKAQEGSILHTVSITRAIHQEKQSFEHRKHVQGNSSCIHVSVPGSNLILYIAGSSSDGGCCSSGSGMCWKEWHMDFPGWQFSVPCAFLAGDITGEELKLGLMLVSWCLLIVLVQWRECNRMYAYSIADYVHSSLFLL
jgi:hypothetical protein